MLTLITVNYNCSARTIALLRSLEAQTEKKFAVMLVDCGSAETDRHELGTYASTTPLALDVIYAENLGYAGGNNLALRKALASGATWMLLINPDTTVAADFVSALTQYTDANPQPALVGVALQEPAHIYHAGRIAWLQSTLIHDLQSPGSSDAKAYIIGAGMLLHRDAVAQAGLLDERYFLYFEDAAYTLTARRAGVPIQFFGGTVISHTPQQSTSTLGTPLLLRYHIRNALLFNRTLGPWWVQAALPVWFFFIIVKQCVKYVFRPSHRPQARAILAGVFDYYGNRFGRIVS